MCASALHACMYCTMYMPGNCRDQKRASAPPCNCNYGVTIVVTYRVGAGS